MGKRAAFGDSTITLRTHLGNYKFPEGFILPQRWRVVRDLVGGD